MVASERMRILRKELREYLSLRSVSPKEREELEAWVRQGYSVFENPWYVYTEDGHPANYLDAKRTMDEMSEQMT